MLVLTRKIGQRICIGDDVTIEIMSIRDKKVRIGVEAPSTISVDREEIRVLKNQEAAEGGKK